MIYLIERAEVSTEDAAAYLEAIDRLFKPRAEAAGLELVACWHSSDSIGRDVEITQVLRFADWGTWDEIRRRMVLDPEIGAWHAARRRLARRAERHFCQPASFSPMA